VGGCVASGMVMAEWWATVCGDGGVEMVVVVVACRGGGCMSWWCGVIVVVVRVWSWL
jgi:hypothetical protein